MIATILRSTGEPVQWKQWISLRKESAAHGNNCDGEFVGTTREDKVSEDWASSAFAGTGDVFETLHSGLTVKLVSTPRRQLETCRKHEQVSVVLGRNPDHFDFIPVLEDPVPQDSRFIGLFNASEARKNGKIEGLVSASYRPLTEEYLIGADASILDRRSGRFSSL